MKMIKDITLILFLLACIILLSEGIRLLVNLFEVL